MELKKLGRIKSLLSQAKSFRGFFDRFDKSVKENSSCDKYGARFNADSRFSNFKVTLSFDSWKGYYGNSSCSTSGPSLNPEDATKYLVQAINLHRKAIFDTMADMMEEDAKSMKAEAEAEICAAQNLLSQIGAEELTQN